MKRNNNMKKFYNVLLIILVISAITTSLLIFIKYKKNYDNEKEVSNFIKEMETEDNKEDSKIKTFKGFETIGIIEIPKIGIKYPIINETNDATMKISITKFWGPNVNEIGNITLAGHNNRDGTMFGKTKNLIIGDIIKMKDLNNNTINYKIFDIYSISPNDVSCVESTKENTREVTLITCTNGHKNRLIIKAQEQKNEE